MGTLLVLGLAGYLLLLANTEDDELSGLYRCDTDLDDEAALIDGIVMSRRW